MEQVIIFNEAEIRQLTSEKQKLAYRLFLQDKTPVEMITEFAKAFPEEYGDMKPENARVNIQSHLAQAKSNLLDIHNRFYTR